MAKLKNYVSTISIIAFVVGGIVLMGCDSYSASSPELRPDSPQSHAEEIKKFSRAKAPPPPPPPPPEQGPGEISVDLDIKPEESPNAINPRSKGVTPVAILQTEEVDPVSQITVASLRFGAPHAVMNDEGAAPAHNGHVTDIDGDGNRDLLLHFPTASTDFTGAENGGLLVGETQDGTPIRGSDSVKLVGVGEGASPHISSRGPSR